MPKVHTGPRGGKYVISRGIKRYIKTSNTSRNKSKRKGSALRGWSKAKPQNQSQRKSLKNKCGTSCFLIPSKNKFPICTSDCKTDCRALIAAKIRARQHGYENVYKKATSLYKKHC